MAGRTKLLELTALLEDPRVLGRPLTWHRNGQGGRGHLHADADCPKLSRWNFERSTTELSITGALEHRTCEDCLSACLARDNVWEVLRAAGSQREMLSSIDNRLTADQLSSEELFIAASSLRDVRFDGLDTSLITAEHARLESWRAALVERIRTHYDGMVAQELPAVATAVLVARQRADRNGTIPGVTETHTTVLGSRSRGGRYDERVETLWAAWTESVRTGERLELLAEVAGDRLHSLRQLKPLTLGSGPAETPLADWAESQWKLARDQAARELAVIWNAALDELLSQTDQVVVGTLLVRGQLSPAERGMMAALGIDDTSGVTQVVTVPRLVGWWLTEAIGRRNAKLHAQVVEPAAIGVPDGGVPDEGVLETARALWEPMNDAAAYGSLTTALAAAAAL